jgi:hypothetical protein
MSSRLSRRCVEALGAARCRSRALALIVALGVTRPAEAVFCGKEASCLQLWQPLVCGLEPTADGFTAELGGAFLKPEQFASVMRPRITFDRKGGWRSEVGPTPSSCLGRAPACTIPIPEPTLDAKTVKALRPELAEVVRDPQHFAGFEQKIAACVEARGSIWFGIEFYDSEGVVGVGGVGRFDPRTHETVLHRPLLLRGSSISAIAHDGQSLWLGTWRIGEGYEQPTHGLVRYDWKRRKMVATGRERDAPCGFFITGLVWVDGSMWVGTDIGISRWIAASRTWEHYLPRPGEQPPLRRTSCLDMYRLTFDALARAPDPRSARIDFMSTLRRLRPAAWDEIRRRR